MSRRAFVLAATLALAAPATARPYKAEIVRDEWGIAHVSGKTDADTVFGMVVAQAEDDFPRIEDNFLTNLGRKAEAEGEGADGRILWQDLRQRLFVDPARLKADYARSPAWLRALMDAWAAGLNHAIATNPKIKPRVLTRFEPWMALSFTEGSIGGDIERIGLGPLAEFYGKHKLALAEPAPTLRDPTGSNGIAIAPSHSASGHPLLLINPHTSFFFRSELQMTSGEGLNAYGAVTWGQFFIYQGFNAHAGWMHTSSGIDNVDEFAETIVTRGGRRFARHLGKLEPVTERRITLQYRSGGALASRSFTTYATRHGPVIRAENGKWIAIALMNRPVPALQQSWLRTRARTLAEFLKVAALKANSSNNTLFADDKGETAYLHPQFVPIRDDSLDWRNPVDGARADWHGLHPFAALPQVINPKTGWAFNVNDSPWAAAGADSPVAARFPRYMDQVGENPRAPHAIRVLTATPKFTLDGLITAAHDSWLPAFDTLVPTLAAAHARHPDPSRDAAIALLTGWDKRWALDSAATSLAVFWGDALLKAGAPAIARGKLNRWEWLEKSATDEQRLAALDEALARLKADFGDWRVPWGEINRYQRNDGAITQIFDDAKPSTPIPFTASTWGSLAAFGAERYPGTKRYYGTRGNSFVAAVEFGPKVHARAVSIGGESNDPANPHFADQVTRYATGNLREVHFHPEEIAAHAVSRTTVTNAP